MRSIKAIIVCCICLLMQDTLLAESPMKILLVGNSQMMVYDLPRMMEVMSESASTDHPRIEIGRAVASGATLKTHWAGAARAMIAKDQWDYVILQEIFNANEADFEKYAELFDNLIRKNGAKPILFATANVSKHYGGGAAFKSFEYPAAFEKLNGMQIAFGKKKGIPVAAAGYAWMKYLGPNPTKEQLLDLYSKDKGHPGFKGTYIYACLLYAHITGLNPSGLASEFKDIKEGIVITTEEAAKMQQAAWDQYQESRTARNEKEQE